jgi:Fe2+ transport system protein FeoA
MTLASLTPGLKYRIDSVDCAHAGVQRLMILGLVEGTEVELASTAIGGDPVEFRMFGNAISLRLDHARRFSVTPLSAGD